MIIFNKTNSIYNSLDESPKAHQVELRWEIIIEQAAAHITKNDNRSRTNKAENELQT